MTAQRRKQPAKKQEPVEQPAPQEEPTPALDEQPVPEPAPEPPAPIEEEVQVPDHVRQLARTVRRHLGNPRIQFDAAQGVPVLLGYQGLFHVVNGHPHTQIATRDELSEMSEQQIWDRVMHGKQPPRQGYPIGGR